MLGTEAVPPPHAIVDRRRPQIGRRAMVQRYSAHRRNALPLLDERRTGPVHCDKQHDSTIAVVGAVRAEPVGAVEQMVVRCHGYPADCG